MNQEPDYDKIMGDRKLFNDFVYTPLSVALKLLDERRKDPNLMQKVSDLLKGDIPEILKEKMCAAQFRHIATPNPDAKHFISISHDTNLTPVFFEYPDDKFTSNNEFKHSLGQLRINKGIDKNENNYLEKISIVDFNKYNGKKLHEVKTLWGDPLTDFHRKLFTNAGFDISKLNFFDISNWFKSNGGNANEYYFSLILLFTCYGILFENFLLNNSEGTFSKEIVLPAIQKVYNFTGLKPLIVPIGPLDIEEDDLWISHNQDVKNLIPNI